MKDIDDRMVHEAQSWKEPMQNMPMEFAHGVMSLIDKKKRGYASIT